MYTAALFSNKFESKVDQTNRFAKRKQIQLLTLNIERCFCAIRGRPDRRGGRASIRTRVVGRARRSRLRSALGTTPMMTTVIKIMAGFLFSIYMHIIIIIEHVIIYVDDGDI